MASSLSSSSVINSNDRKQNANAPLYFRIPESGMYFNGVDMSKHPPQQIYPPTNMIDGYYMMYISFKHMRGGASCMGDFLPNTTSKPNSLAPVLCDAMLTFTGLGHVTGIYDACDGGLSSVYSRDPDTPSYAHSVFTITEVYGPSNLEKLEEGKRLQTDYNTLDEYQEALLDTRTRIGLVCTFSEGKCYDDDLKVPDEGPRGGDRSAEHKKREQKIAEREARRSPPAILHGVISSHAIASGQHSVGQQQTGYNRHYAKESKSNNPHGGAGPPPPTFLSKLTMEKYTKIVSHYSPFPDSSIIYNTDIRGFDSSINPLNVFSLDSAIALMKRDHAAPEYLQRASWYKRDNQIGERGRAGTGPTFPIGSRFTYRIIPSELCHSTIMRRFFPWVMPPPPSVNDPVFQEYMSRYVDPDNVNDVAINRSVDYARNMASAHAVLPGSGITLAAHELRTKDAAGKWRHVYAPLPHDDIELKRPGAKERQQAADYRAQAAARTEFQRRAIEDFGLVFKEWGELSPAQNAVCVWLEDALSKYNKHGFHTLCLPSESKTAYSNLTQFGSMIQNKLLVHEQQFGSYVTHSKAMLLEIAALTVGMDRGMHLNVFLPGTTATGKSKMLDDLMSKLIEGTYTKCGNSSRQSAFTSNNLSVDCMIKIWPEVPPDLIGYNPNNIGKGSKGGKHRATGAESAQTDRAAELREQMSSGLVAYDRFEIDPVTGQSLTVTYIQKGRCVFIVAMNAIANDIADNMLSRMLVNAIHIWARPDLTFFQRFTQQPPHIILKMKEAYIHRFRRDQALMIVLYQWRKTGIIGDVDATYAMAFILEVLKAAEKKGSTCTREPRSIERVNIVVDGVCQLDGIYRYCDGPLSIMSEHEHWDWFKFRGVEHLLVATVEHAIFALTLCADQWEDPLLCEFMLGLNLATKSRVCRTLTNATHKACENCNAEPGSKHTLTCPKSQKKQKKKKAKRGRPSKSLMIGDIDSRQFGADEKDEKDEKEAGEFEEETELNVPRTSILQPIPFSPLYTEYDRDHDDFQRVIWKDPTTVGKYKGHLSDEDRAVHLASILANGYMKKAPAKAAIQALCISLLTSEIWIPEKQKSIPVLTFVKTHEGDEECRELHIAKAWARQTDADDTSIIMSCIETVLAQTGHLDGIYITARTRSDTPWLAETVERKPLEDGAQKRAVFRLTNLEYSNHEIDQILQGLCSITLPTFDADAAAAELRDQQRLNRFGGEGGANLDDRKMIQHVKRMAAISNKVFRAYEIAMSKVQWYVVREGESAYDSVMQRRFFRMRVTDQFLHGHIEGDSGPTRINVINEQLYDSFLQRVWRQRADSMQLIEFPADLIDMMKRPQTTQEFEEIENDPKNKNDYSLSNGTCDMLRIMGPEDDLDVRVRQYLKQKKQQRTPSLLLEYHKQAAEEEDKERKQSRGNSNSFNLRTIKPPPPIRVHDRHQSSRSPSVSSSGASDDEDEEEKKRGSRRESKGESKEEKKRGGPPPSSQSTRERSRRLKPLGNSLFLKDRQYVDVLLRQKDSNDQKSAPPSSSSSDEDNDNHHSSGLSLGGSNALFNSMAKQQKRQRDSADDDDDEEEEKKEEEPSYRAPDKRARLISKPVSSPRNNQDDEALRLMVEQEDEAIQLMVLNRPLPSSSSSLPPPSSSSSSSSSLSSLLLSPRNDEEDDIVL